MSNEPAVRGVAPVVVVGVGNMLLHDDGVGLVLLEELAKSAKVAGEVDFIDGGTQGLALLGALEDRRAALFLDAVALGAPPGTVHVVTEPLGRGVGRSGTAHEGNVRELLAVAQILGQLPKSVVVVGIEPAVVRTGIGLSPVVEAALPGALREARTCLDAMCGLIAEAVHA